MVPERKDDNESRERRIENATPRGRYGDAPEEKPHLSPEVPPATGRVAEARPAHPQAGALPENRGEDVDETTEQRE